jgi:hypothetical protein
MKKANIDKRSANIIIKLGLSLLTKYPLNNDAIIQIDDIKTFK